MLTRSLTALVLAATPQVPTPTCKLAGPAVEAHWSGAIPPASRADAPLRVVADVPLPGSGSRFDYQSLEPASGRLFISHMGAGPYASATGDHEVVVVNDSTFQIVARVPGPRFPDGIAYAPEERRVFVSDESGRRDFVIDAATNTVVAQIELGGEAGNTQYDAGSHCVVVAVQTANQLAGIDPATATIGRPTAPSSVVRGT